MKGERRKEKDIIQSLWSVLFKDRCTLIHSINIHWDSTKDGLYGYDPHLLGVYILVDNHSLLSVYYMLQTLLNALSILSCIICTRGLRMLTLWIMKFEIQKSEDLCPSPVIQTTWDLNPGSLTSKTALLLVLLLHSISVGKYTYIYPHLGNIYISPHILYIYTLPGVGT